MARYGFWNRARPTVREYEMLKLTDLRLAAAASAAALAFAAGPTLAQTSPSQTPPSAQTQTTLDAMLRAKGEEYHRAPDAEQNPAEVQATQALNAEIAVENRAAAELEADEEAGYARAVARNATDVAETDALRAQYEADLAAATAAKAEYDRAHAVWEGLIRGCEASGRTDCRVNVP